MLCVQERRVLLPNRLFGGPSTVFRHFFLHLPCVKNLIVRERAWQPTMSIAGMQAGHSRRTVFSRLRERPKQLRIAADSGRVAVARFGWLPSRF
mmetsp:Transcript_8094/g.24314  ORF Transcript_8094/g.24314 Transcript_8094/m.24314 type:complete len:94 (-) Transcript_8094:69-350(-)